MKIVDRQIAYQTDDDDDDDDDVLCELRKFLPKYRMWPMPSYIFWNLAILFSNSSLGNEKLSRTDIR